MILFTNILFLACIQATKQTINFRMIYYKTKKLSQLVGNYFQQQLKNKKGQFFEASLSKLHNLSTKVLFYLLILFFSGLVTFFFWNFHFLYQFKWEGRGGETRLRITLQTKKRACSKHIQHQLSFVQFATEHTIFSVFTKPCKGKSVIRRTKTTKLDRGV